MLTQYLNIVLEVMLVPLNNLCRVESFGKGFRVKVRVEESYSGNFQRFRDLVIPSIPDASLPHLGQKREFGKRLFVFWSQQQKAK